MPEGTNIQQRLRLRLNWYRVLEGMMITTFGGVMVLLFAGAFTFLWQMSTSVDRTNRELQKATEVLTEEVSRLKIARGEKRLARLEEAVTKLAEYVAELPGPETKVEAPMYRPEANAPPDWRMEQRIMKDLIEQQTK